jgi:NAD(P)-dependent dehydrogenase (short-subunit alcohol dehydrogenase family)
VTVELSTATAVVTGAASGIGEAIARGLLARGATVVLGDLDAPRLEVTAGRLADDHPGRIALVAGNAADPEHVEALLAAAPAPVDLFVANAGVFRGFGLDAAEDEWALGWDVNVMGQVRAARALVPTWLENDGGCFVTTASAAGLLTQLGSPTYSVTKHAAVGFAEWLAATYGDRGVQVCCLCPMGVRTDMLAEGESSQDAEARLALTSVVSAGSTLTPDDVADALLVAIAEGRFFALPHPEVGTMYARKADDTDHWISGMQRFRTSLEG